MDFLILYANLDRLATRGPHVHFSGQQKQRELNHFMRLR
jgi:hypothetical protein